MKEYFPNIIDKDFTANMENQLDEVAEGQIQWKSIVQEFYDPFMRELEVADEKIGHVELVDEVTEEICPKCGRNLVIKHGRFGKFLACPGFPQCRFTKPLLQTLEIKCPKCGKGDVVIRQTKKKKKFYGCSDYPECDYTSWYEPVATLCPVCGKNLVKRPSGSGTRLACATEGCSFKPSMLKEDKAKEDAPEREEAN